MNPYDQAHELAKTLKNSEEYREYARLREVAYESDTNQALLDEYKRLQFMMQAKMASGERMPEEDLQRLQQIGTLLQFNQDVSAYLLAEFRFQRMLSEIFKILAEVAGVDLDMLTQG
ncbi:MAG: YlbF family regulator [Christensenellales bacterium]|nr:YlbF family regulator [Christensenellales bacterium]